MIQWPLDNLEPENMNKDISDRVIGVLTILDESIAELGMYGSAVIENDTFKSTPPNPVKQAVNTGFMPSNYRMIFFLADGLAETGIKGISLEIGCGNGTWTLVAAAMGFPSYGIDINPFLVEEAEKNYQEAVRQGFIDPKTPCGFAAGSVYQGKWGKLYHKIRDNPETMPTDRNLLGRLFGKKPNDPYQELGMRLQDVRMIYSLMFMQHWAVLGPMLEEETLKDTLYLGDVPVECDYMSELERYIHIKNK